MQIRDRLFVWISVIVGAGVGIRWAIREMRSRRARSWPAVQGIVESTNLRVLNSTEGDIQIAEVSYSYRVEGKYYGGHHQLGDAGDLNTFPKGSGVTIHYNPLDRSKSFLNEHK